MDRRDVVARVVWVLAISVLVVAWCAAGAFAVAIGMFGAADTSCDGGTPRVNMEGGWVVIGAAGIWAIPFTVWAVGRRSLVSVVAALVTACVAGAVIAVLFSSPGEFCF